MSRAAKTSFQWGDGTLQVAVWGAKARTPCELSKKGVCMPRKKRNSQSIGAMEAVSRKVQNVSTYIILLSEEWMEV